MSRLINGQEYIRRKKSGQCCECFCETHYWLTNAQDYFCLSEKCFRDRRRWEAFKSFKQEIETRFENSSKVLRGIELDND